MTKPSKKSAQWRLVGHNPIATGAALNLKDPANASVVFDKASSINLMWIRDGKGKVLIKKTAAYRRKFIALYKLPKNCRFYNGWSITKNGDGIPVFSKNGSNKKTASK